MTRKVPVLLKWFEMTAEMKRMHARSAALRVGSDIRLGNEQRRDSR